MGHSARIDANSLTWADGSVRRTRSASRCGRSTLRNTRTCRRGRTWTARRQKKNEQQASVSCDSIKIKTRQSLFLKWYLGNSKKISKSEKYCLLNALHDG